ncbi:MAG: hypothetical protein Q8R00_01900 [Candidatus Nanoarchaeia archaeon]|nr:hypothetical protein [Candidatus Nanoarchaeia archaeon]
MIQELFLFWSSAASVIFLLITFIMFIKNRRFEKKEFEPGINAVLFGVFLTFVSAIIYTLNFAFVAYPRNSALYIATIQPYVPLALQAVEIGLMPLIAICILLGIFSMKESLQ